MNNNSNNDNNNNNNNNNINIKKCNIKLYNNKTSKYLNGFRSINVISFK